MKFSAKDQSPSFNVVVRLQHIFFYIAGPDVAATELLYNNVFIDTFRALFWHFLFKKLIKSDQKTDVLVYQKHHT